MTKNYHKSGTTVEVRDGNINAALKKFKKKVDESNKLIELIKRTAYEKPTTERKRKKGAARARWLKKLEAESLPKKLF
jgi:small subunit ribosomal protein S21